MSAPDPRHGTVAGYNRIPCRDECCRHAMATYKARWTWDTMNGRARIIDATGTRRRIEALMALGWSGREIGRRLGMTANNVTRIRKAATITAAMAGRVALVYDELSMTLPTGSAQAIAHVRNLARGRGYAPPLAWLNIDDPDEQPASAWTSRRPSDDIDPVVVERLLAGELVDSTAAEKREVVRRWQAAGRPLRELEQRFGWKADRYTTTDARGDVA